MLANIISSGFYPELSTVEKALKLTPPKNGPSFRIITLADEGKKKPVFPAWSQHGPKGTVKAPNSWGAQASDWAIRAGLATGLGLHSARREALIKANVLTRHLKDNGYTLGQVLKFASQNNPNVLIHSYLGNVSTIDGAASFLGLERRTDLAEDFRSVTMKWNPALNHSIPIREQRDLENSPEYRSIKDRIAEIKSLKESAPKDSEEALKLQLKAEQDKLRALRKKKLKDLQASQKIIYESVESPHEQWDARRSHFHRIKHMLSEPRTRLMEVMKERVPPRSKKWISALQDLVTLRTTSSRLAFQNVLMPTNDGYCPVSSCKMRMDKIIPPKQWSHIYRCYKKNLIDEFGFAQFCFLCSSWQTSKEDWKTHCQQHIERDDVPFRCDPVTFRYATAHAGYCPVATTDVNLVFAAWGDLKPPEEEMMVDPELYKATTDNMSAAEILETHIDDTNSYEASLIDDPYDADCILAKWKEGRKMLYLVKWDDGTTTWEPQEEILKQDLISKFEKGYKGFNKGIEVFGTRINGRSKKVEYKIRFLNYAGAEKDKSWWVPESTMDPEIRQNHTTAKQTTRKRRKRS
ncbi:uncharacterized protein TRIVIDRAFT_47147 [Trichoderma virens Gv29-8]|uniref:Chromo domain-containing protein n=1 Tax=Hypocrea virens (strain Gv29-8 / FGSC 10586) TaxID=413071 RepID=G9N0L1_HYPVG|nr:uncharacterized protein TRIVIDRAFT_47147 [Trichoderma virens Gv29-8]EHK19893.1 hypothetical protein TRIVIDRAFT_47147 [Trichoderma virens Gv29-8]